MYDKLVVTNTVQGNGSDIGIDIWTAVTNRKREMMCTVRGYTIVVSKGYPDLGYFTGLRYTGGNQGIDTILQFDQIIQAGRHTDGVPYPEMVAMMIFFITMVIIIAFVVIIIIIITMSCFAGIYFHFYISYIYDHTGQVGSRPVI